MSLVATIDRLTDEVETLREENRQLREMLFGCDAQGLMAMFRLTQYEARIFSCIVQSEIASHETIISAVWKGCHEPAFPDNNIKVMMARIRKKVPEWAKPVSVWRLGYRLLPEARKRIKAMLAERNEAGNE